MKHAFSVRKVHIKCTAQMGFFCNEFYFFWYWFIFRLHIYFRCISKLQMKQSLLSLCRLLHQTIRSTLYMLEEIFMSVFMQNQKTPQGKYIISCYLWFLQCKADHIYGFYLIGNFHIFNESYYINIDCTRE